jgi:hypothetical protein
LWIREDFVGVVGAKPNLERVFIGMAIGMMIENSFAEGLLDFGR